MLRHLPSATGRARKSLSLNRLQGKRAMCAMFQPVLYRLLFFHSLLPSSFFSYTLKNTGDMSHMSQPRISRCKSIGYGRAMWIA